MQRRSTTIIRVLAATLASSLCISTVRAHTQRRLDVLVRGKALTLEAYVPSTPPAGTILMGSGDVGWVGLGVAMAELLRSQGYLVVGINVRQYLAAFTEGQAHLTVAEPPRDYRAIADRLRLERLLAGPVVLSGVSEGAAIAVLAAADQANHQWVDGVITMGIPAEAELAWRWRDIGAWITRADLHEPSFKPYDFVGALAPLPFVMIQSTRDEFASAGEYESGFASAREPKKLILIDASNHRFTDRRAELQAQFLAALDWVRAHRVPQR